MKARIIIFIVVPIVLLALALVGGSDLLLRLFFLSVLVPLVSFLWTLFGIRGISAAAERPPEHCQVGEQVQQKITIYNDSKLPKFWLGILGNTDMPGHQETTAINLLPKRSHHWQSTVHCRRRGRYHIGSVIATATDPLGLFSQRCTLGNTHSILVYPATHDIPLFKLSPFNDFGYGSGHRSLRQIGTNASSVREFATGDSLHHIHWGSTAHTGKLMVKVFDADRSASTAKNVWVVLDMQKACNVGQGEETTEEYGITIAASVVKKYLENGMEVGMTALGDQTYLFPPNRGDEHFRSILEALAVMKATGEVPIDQLILEQMKRFSDNSLVIIISPSAAGHLVTAARRLKNRVDSVVALLLDATSFGGGTGAINTARNMSLAGVHSYIIGQGDELATVLGERFDTTHLRYF